MYSTAFAPLRHGVKKHADTSYEAAAILLAYTYPKQRCLRCYFDNLTFDRTNFNLTYDIIELKNQTERD